MPSNETACVYAAEQRAQLSRLARKSIHYGLQQGRPLTVDLADYDAALRTPRATFVTLNRLGQLRGCIGHLEPTQALAADVAENAFSAAFRDPRFPPLQAEEEGDLDLHISVLSPSTTLDFASEQDLLDQIRPGVDGLILEEGYHRGTFLPSVWDALPDPHQFLEHLKLKSGLPSGHWSDRIRVSRYTTESWSG